MCEGDLEVICGPDIKRRVGGRYVCGCLRGKWGFGEVQGGPVVITSDLSARSRASQRPLQMHPVCKAHVPQSERERLSGGVISVVIPVEVHLCVHCLSIHLHVLWKIFVDNDSLGLFKCSFIIFHPPY